MCKRILIIDDDIDLLDIMQEALIYEGFEVVTSPDAADHEKLIRQNQVDLLILDYFLKGCNGGEICQQIKCCKEFEHLPILMFSAYPLGIKALDMYKCDVFIPKPFDLSDIVGYIIQLLSSTTSQVFTN
jgi:DNA-binding response OmpR family regulator